MHVAMRMRGRLDVGALRNALRAIVRRHEALRTRFDAVGGAPVQMIDSDVRLDLPVTDLTAMPAASRDNEARRLAQLEARTPFDLARDALLRARLLRLADDEHVALLTMHHIVSDGWSMGVLVRELAAAVRRDRRGRCARTCPPLPVQYADYAHWQREWLQGEVLDAQLAYWKQQLADAPALLALPTDRPRPAVQTLRGATFEFR